MAAGDFADVFIGRDGHGNKVALKRPRYTGTTNVDERADRTIINEVQTWLRFDHEYLLPFLGATHIDGRLYLVSPFIENGPLPTYIHSNPETDRVRLLIWTSGQLRECADALAYLHRQRVLHGDIKGSNVLVSDDGHVRLCDFGLTRLEEAMTSMELRGAGSFHWQALELWNGEPKSTKTDVYAYGMLIAEVTYSLEAPLSA
ncbi:hypothetical protein FRB99_000139 [Tulasnella sp. 403]|nr:hypothetical protein FRB99_000139 [Tulasnella sp. 403]